MSKIGTKQGIMSALMAGRNSALECSRLPDVTEDMCKDYTDKAELMSLLYDKLEDGTAEAKEIEVTDLPYSSAYRILQAYGVISHDGA